MSKRRDVISTALLTTTGPRSLSPKWRWRGGGQSQREPLSLDNKLQFSTISKWFRRSDGKTWWRYPLNPKKSLKYDRVNFVRTTRWRQHHTRVT